MCMCVAQHQRVSKYDKMQIKERETSEGMKVEVGQSQSQSQKNKNQNPKNVKSQKSQKNGPKTKVTNAVRSEVRRGPTT